MQVNWFCCKDGSWVCLDKDVARELEIGYGFYMKGMSKTAKYKDGTTNGFVNFSKMMVFYGDDEQAYTEEGPFFKLRRIVEA